MSNTNRKLSHGVWIRSLSIFAHFRAPDMSGMFLGTGVRPCNWESYRCLHFSNSSIKSWSKTWKLGLKICLTSPLPKKVPKTASSFNYQGENNSNCQSRWLWMLLWIIITSMTYMVSPWMLILILSNLWRPNKEWTRDGDQSPQPSLWRLHSPSEIPVNKNNC